MRAFLKHFPPASASWTEALDNSNCNLSVDLLRWRLRFDAGIDGGNSAVELAWLYVSVGPVHLMLAIGH